MKDAILRQYRITGFWPYSPSSALATWAFDMHERLGFPVECTKDLIEKKPQYWVIVAAIAWIDAYKELKNVA